MKYKLNGNWVELSIKALDGLPIGFGIEYYGSTNTIPTGWLVCDGSAISRTDYSELFSIIGTTYGIGDGSTTFNLPNLKGRVAVGYDSSDTSFDALGETGGAKTVTLTVDQIPSHNHPIYKTKQGLNGTGSIQYDAIAYCNNMSQGSGSTQNRGGGQAHNNLQPYIVVNYIIKVSNTTPTMASIVDGYSTSTQDGYSCNYANKNLVYSTSEVDTGKKWIDGKTIYRKVFTGTKGTNPYAIGSIDNLGVILSTQGIMIKQNGTGQQPIGYFNNDNYFTVIKSSSGSINIYAPTAYSNGTYYVTLEYTKSN